MQGLHRAALLLLADGRLPASGHAHSGGIEAATVDGSVTDLGDLERFLRGRLATAGLVAATFAAATCRSSRRSHPGGSVPAKTVAAETVTALAGAVADLDAELDARTPSPAQRSASRAQGRALLRAGRAAWPGVSCPIPAPHHPVAFGLVAAHAGLSPADAALAVAYGAVSGPASAATRLLALDPLAVTAVLARLSTDVEHTAAEATALSNRPPADLPATTAPRLELLAERHHTAEIRMFAS
ncbi:urease accessory protein UreF [Candidatus Protofrankia californiensis]|uniref:urease accessory protein UreF n=1 Tax=Candidatus Protofrankia californiensis TaxID=1839754 RepID=UPI001040F86A|nr:urease accessory UreF family protein [Candidatus Protofrankia californiensis]